MAVARKSAVSRRDTWFRRATRPLGNSGSAHPKEATRSASTPVTSKRQRRSSKNLSVSSTNRTATPTPVHELGKHQLPNLNRQSAVPKSKGGNSQRVPVMPNSESAPLWLLRLYALHRHSSIVAFLLVAATLVVYGWTVYSQELWSQGYRRLQNLQRQERQLTTTNEVLENKMAVEGERPAAGLVAPTPAKMIFLNPAPHSPNLMPPMTTPNSELQQQAPAPGY